MQHSKRHLVGENGGRTLEKRHLFSTPGKRECIPPTTMTTGNRACSALSVTSHKEQNVVGNVAGVNTEPRWGEWGRVKGEDKENITVENIANNIFTLESLHMNIF